MTTRSRYTAAVTDHKKGWWNLASGCLSAWQPKGAGSYAASLIDLASGHNINAGVAPAWSFNTGWYFNGTSNYLLSSAYPIYNGDFTLAVYANPIITHNSSSVFMAHASTSRGWICKSNQWNNTGKLGYTQRTVADYTSSIDTPASDSVFFFTKSGTSVNVYSNDDTSAITVSATYNEVNLVGLLIGCCYGSSGAPADFYKNYIYAIALYNNAISAEQRSSVRSAMRAL